MSVNHQPVKDGQCTSCHTAHGSSHENLLNKNQPALCLTCHLDIAKYWMDDYYHKPAIQSCLTCHGSHGANVDAILVKPSGSLCIDCHEANTGEFLKAHGQIKPGLDSCVTCHDSHGGKSKSLIYPVVHSPFEEGTCTPCHTGGKK